MKKILFGNGMDRMPNWAFKMMSLVFKVTDILKSPTGKLDPFNIQEGQIVIDYGCGTGRYLKQASQSVGEHGLVYAIDIHELAIESTFRQIKRFNLKNVMPILTDGKNVNLSSHLADVLYALDMFHMVIDTKGFLKELNRLAKPEGLLYLEDGHQPRSLTRQKVLESGCWDIIGEHKSFISCRPRSI